MRATLLKTTLSLLCGLALLSSATLALAQGEINTTIGKSLAGQADSPVTIFVAKKVLTMEPGNPDATAVAVSGKRIVAVGSIADVKAALRSTKYVVDETFAGKVVLPGFIDQHLHPILGALTLSTEVIATEDWAMPERTFKAAATPAAYQGLLKAAEAAMKDRNEWLFSWAITSCGTGSWIARRSTPSAPLGPSWCGSVRAMNSS